MEVEEEGMGKSESLHERRVSIDEGVKEGRRGMGEEEGRRRDGKEDVRVKAAGFVEELEVEGGGGLAVDWAGGDGHLS